MVKVAEASKPLRRAMHELGLCSGLRPGTLVTLRREWVKLGPRAISIPKMKSGRSFDLPLSEHMLEMVSRALELSEMLFPGAPWLFPTRSSKNQNAIICTQVWREKSLPSETGYRRSGNLRAVQLLLGHTKIESTVRYVGVEIDDTIEIAVKIDV